MKTDFQPGRRGCVFKDGKLFLFEKTYVLVMRGWPAPRAWVKSKTRWWKPDRRLADRFFVHLVPPSERPSREPPDPSEVVVRPPDDEEWTDEQRQREWDSARFFQLLGWRRGHVHADYFDTIPDSVRSALLGYRKRRWHMLCLMARCPDAYDLHVSNPALCYALASNWVFHKPAVQRPMRAARSLMRKKQRTILQWLGFPPTEAVRHIFKKIVPASLSVEMLLYLRQTLNEPSMLKILCHLPRLNAGALRLINDRVLWPYLTPRLLEDVSRQIGQDEQPYTYRLLMDTLRMNQRLGGRQCPARFSSLNRLREVHDDLSGHVERFIDRNRYQLPKRFPDPPFAGTADIQPLRTPEELLIEGRTMHHCAASHAWLMAEGREYIYRVTAPVRATLSVYLKGSTWCPGQVHKACNKTVPRETRELIFRDLFQSGRSQPTCPDIATEHASLMAFDHTELPVELALDQR